MAIVWIWFWYIIVFCISAGIYWIFFCIFCSFDVIKLALSWLNLLNLPKLIFSKQFSRLPTVKQLKRPVLKTAYKQFFLFPSTCHIKYSKCLKHFNIPLILDKQFFFFDSSYTQFCGVITWNHKNSTFSYFHSNKNSFNRSFTQRKNPDNILYSFLKKQIFSRHRNHFFVVVRSDIMIIHKYVKKIFCFLFGSLLFWCGY